MSPLATVMSAATIVVIVWDCGTVCSLLYVKMGYRQHWCHWADRPG